MKYVSSNLIFLLKKTRKKNSAWSNTTNDFRENNIKAKGKTQKLIKK